MSDQMKNLTCTACGAEITTEHVAFRGFLANQIARNGSELVTLKAQEESLLKRKFSKAFKKKWEEDEVLRKIITDKISTLEDEQKTLEDFSKKFFHGDLDLH